MRGSCSVECKKKTGIKHKRKKKKRKTQVFCMYTYEEETWKLEKKAKWNNIVNLSF